MATMIGMTLLLLALAVLAVRYGYDSRAGLRSAEHRLASYGYAWADLADERKMARQMRALQQVRRLNGRAWTA